MFKMQKMNSHSSTNPISKSDDYPEPRVWRKNIRCISSVEVGGPL